MNSQIFIRQVIEKEIFSRISSKNNPEVIVKIDENRHRFRRGLSLHDLVLAETSVGFVLYKVTEFRNANESISLTLTLKRYIYNSESNI